MEIKDIAEYEEKDSRLARNTIAELHRIINEAKEFIYKCNDGKQGINYSGCSKLLEILGGDKE